MSVRYYLYIFGGIAFFALFSFAYATMHKLNIKVDGLSYLNDKIIEQESLIIRLKIDLEGQPNTPALANKEEQLQPINQFSYKDAPNDLFKDRSFQMAIVRHQELKQVIASMTQSQSQENRKLLLIAAEAAQTELENAHHTQFLNIKSDVSYFVWVCGVLLTLSGISIGVPFYIQHERSLNQARKTNDRLKLKAQELSATHSTMGNMLEDIIHERKQATRTAEINARLAAIINSADDAIFSLNLTGIIATANEAALRLFGDHIVGQRFTQIFDDNTATKLRSLIMTTGEQKTGTAFDIDFAHNGHRIDLSITLSPIRSEYDNLAGYSVIAKDISNTKQEEERFRLAVEAAPNAMIMVNHHGYIVLVNSEAERMFGFTRQELYGQSISLLVPDNIKSIHTQHLKNFMENTEKRSMGQKSSDLKGQRKDGHKFPIEVGLTPIKIDGKPFVISSIIDTSERLKQQYELYQLNHELSQKNQEMEQFIYAVSHDLKAPLVTISGFAERLLKDTSIVANTRNRHKLERIVSNVNSMDALLQDLLSLSRVIKRDLEKAWVDPEEALETLLNSLEVNIKNCDAEIKIIRPLYPIYAQESLLLQCLQNLLSNALKYRNTQIKTTIVVSPIRDKNETGLSVSDNGIGIPEKHQDRIFNVFERLNPDLCDGNGVGLSIVKTIMDKHNGKVSLESTENSGSKFTLIFPHPTDDSEPNYENAKFKIAQK